MSWVLPALKAILPHVGTIIEAAKPVFHRRSAGGGKPTVEEQIAELQAATTQNGEHIQALAEHLRKTVTVLEHAAETSQAQLRRAYVVSGIAVVLGVGSSVIALVALLR